MTGPHISIRDLTMCYGSRVIQENLTFDINRGDIFVIMGGSGCGKSTLLRHLVGLIEPAKGEILYDGFNFTRAEPEQREFLGDAVFEQLRRLEADVMARQIDAFVAERESSP